MLKDKTAEIAADVTASGVADGVAEFGRIMTRLGSGAGLGFRVLELADNQEEWSEDTFGTDEELGPQDALLKLMMKSDEALEAFQSEDHAKASQKLADAFLLLMDASRRSGLNFATLVHVASLRQTENEAKTDWTDKTFQDYVSFHLDGLAQLLQSETPRTPEQLQNLSGNLEQLVKLADSQELTPEDLV